MISWSHIPMFGKIPRRLAQQLSIFSVLRKARLSSCGILDNRCQKNLQMKMVCFNRVEMTNQNDLPKIGAPATRALQSTGITRLKQLTKVTEAELLQLHGMGPKAVRILR